MGFKRTSAPPASSSYKRKKGAKKAKTLKTQKNDDNTYHKNRRFKFQTYAQQLENISVEHFQKRAGFVGMKPAEHSSWFHASVMAWRDSNLTAAFAGLCNELEMLMRSGTVAQVLLVKEELVQALLTAMKKDVTKSATIVFSHLLAMLAKDLGEELFNQFIPIWKALSHALIGCEDAEVSEALINCQMFYLRRFIDLLIEHVQEYSQVFLDGLLETTNSALRRTAANTLAYYFCKCQLENIKNFLNIIAWDKKKIYAVGEALILAASKQVELVKAAFSNPELALYVCIKVLLNTQEPEDVWNNILECQPSIKLLNSCVALRKASKVKLHSKILEQITGSTVEEALLMGLLIKSCDLPTLLSIRKCVQEKLNVVNRNALVLFLEELGFDLWQGFSGVKISVDSWITTEADCIVKPALSIEGNSFEQRLLKTILQKDESIIQELVGRKNSAAILYFECTFPREYLLLSLASHNPKVIEKSLERLESPFAKKLLVITQVPADLERFKEKINLMAAVERDLEQLSGGEYEELFWYLLGACHIKLSLVMPAVSKLLNQAAARKPKIWASVYSSYIAYISEEARDGEIYDVHIAPEVTKEKSVLLDDNLEKLPSLLKRVETITSDSYVQFGELFCKNVSELAYPLVSPSRFGNVLSILAKAPAACSPVDLNKLVVFEDNYNAALKKSIQSHFLDLLTAYSKSSSIKTEALMSLVSIGDEQIQLKALECLSSASAEYAPIVEILKPILNEKTWREHLAMLTMQRNELLFSNYLWSTILREITIRVLYGRLIARKLAKNKSAMQVRRKAILGFVAAWPATDLECFVAFTRANLKMELSVVLGYLSLLEYVIRYLPLTTNCVNDTFDMILALLSGELGSDKRARSLGMKRILELLAKRDTIVDDARLEYLFEFLKPLIEKLSTEYMQNESSLVELFALLTKDERYLQVFCNSVIADNLVKCLTVNPRNKVFIKALVILENVLPKVNLKKMLIGGLMQKVQLFAGLLSKSTQEIFSQLVRLIMLVAQEQKESVEDVHALKRALLPLLKLKKVPINVKCDVCQAACGLFADSTTCADEYFKVLCALTISNTDVSLRCSITELLGALSINSPSYSTCFTLLQELFSMMHGMLEEADYDRRFRCFSDIRSGNFVLDTNSKLLLAHVCLYYVLNEPNELSMRNQSMLHLQENIESIIDLYLEYLPVAFKSEHELVRLDYCSLLGKAVPVCGKLQDLAPLLHGGDEEAEVFGNLAHLQQHRKIRAIRRLCNGMPTGHFMAQHFVSFMLAWAVPLPNTPSNPALQQEAAKAVGELSSKCTPNQAQRRLDHLLKIVEKDVAKEKPILKVIPYVLEHMPLGEGTEGFLPKLMNLMRQKSNTTELVRIPIAIAIAQLLVRLSKTKEYLPAILSTLITSLKSKLEDTRKKARDALQSVFRILSTTGEDLAIVMESFIREMRAVMEPGYQRHVMISSINHILTPLIPSLDVSDTLFELIVDCLEEDLFGRLAKERETSEWTGKVLEAKSCRGFDLLGAFAKRASAERLARIQERFRPLGQRNVRNLEKLLNVWLNAFDRTELLPFLINLANPNYYTGEEKYNEDAKWQLLGMKSAVVLIKRVSTDQSLPEEYLSEGERLKAISFGHLYGTHSSLMIAALRFICYSLKWTFWVEEEKRQIVLRCFELIVKSAGNGDLVSECFKYVSLVVRDHPQVRVSDQQLKALLTHTRAHLEDLERQQLTFSLLKSLLSRAVATEHYPLELYELMTDVSQSMVTSHHAVTRQHCRYLMAQFLADCPLSAQKFEEHYERILTDSANYIHLTGRNSCRELLSVLVKRRLIKEGMKRLFLTLTGSYAQETELDGLEMIDSVIKEMTELMRKDLTIVNEMLKKWLASGQSGIIQAAQRALRVIHSVTNGKGLNKELLKYLQ